jgi:hypothetical protein
MRYELSDDEWASSIRCFQTSRAACRVWTTAIKLVAGHISPLHRDAARDKFAEFKLGG